MREKYFDIYSQLNAYVESNTPAESEYCKALRDITEKNVDFAFNLSSPIQIQFIQFLIKLIGAKQVLEIGVFTGYSTLAIAEALPDDGKVIACDKNHEWPKVGLPFWQKAGVVGKIDLQLRPALETLHLLQDEKPVGHFDFVFIDADKINYHHYLDLVLPLLSDTGLIVFDNTLFIHNASVLEPNVPSMRAINQFNQQLRDDTRVDSCLLTVAEGMTLVRKKR